MAISDAMDMVLRLKFEAAIQDHVAKKATNKRIRANARKAASDLRERARLIEDVRAEVRQLDGFDLRRSGA